MAYLGYSDGSEARLVSPAMTAAAGGAGADADPLEMFRVGMMTLLAEADTLTMFRVCNVILLVGFMLARWQQCYTRSRKGDQDRDAMSSGGDQDKGSMMYTTAEPCWPRSEIFSTSNPAVCEFDSGLCYGRYMVIHKPTHNLDLMRSGKYPYSEHLHGRKRNWELRLQLVFRKQSDGTIYVGSESLLARNQDKDYVRNSFANRLVTSSLVGIVRRAVGNIYQTDGDDPAVAANRDKELERTSFMFPLGLVDQLHVTEEGEEPPNLTDPMFPKFGLVRATNRTQFRKTIAALKINPGTTYTLSYWSPAQFVDAVTWKCTGLGAISDVDLRNIGLLPPNAVVMYVLRDDETESRHLDSRKSYMFRMVLWPSYLPPSEEQMRELHDQHVVGSEGQLQQQLDVAPPRIAPKIQTKQMHWCFSWCR